MVVVSPQAHCSYQIDNMTEIQPFFKNSQIINCELYVIYWIKYQSINQSFLFSTLFSQTKLKYFININL